MKLQKRAPSILPLIFLTSCTLEPLPSSGDVQSDVERPSCKHGPGSYAERAPHARNLPVEHIVVLMQENRSFDHYFQKLPEYGQPDVDVAPDDFSNPDPDGNPVPIFHDTTYCFLDPPHSWAASDRQWDGGRMDGFVIASHRKLSDVGGGLPATLLDEMLSGRRAMGYYDATDLPYYYELASQFSIADRYFASVMGPTWPNRMYLYAASSYGITRNEPVKGDRVTIFDLLEEARVRYAIYADEQPGIAVFTKDLARHKAHVRPLDAIQGDIERGTLPAVAFVDPILGNRDYVSTDEHPPAMAQIGQLYIAKILNALMKSALWSSSVAFLVYDEHGGLWDHVPPPPACVPDNVAPILPERDRPGAFDRYGFRVPFIVVSPFAKKHHVSHETYDHTSITRFIEARFGLPAMTRRDANAKVPWDMFDFDRKPHARPPEIPLPVLDQAKIDACTKVFRGRD